MVLEIITTDPNNWFILSVIIGGLIGSVIGTMLPYWREQRKLGRDGIDLIFDKAFLKATAGAFILSTVALGAVYPQLLANADPAASYITTIITTAGLAFSLNIVGNWLVGTGKITEEAKLQQAQVRLGRSPNEDKAIEEDDRQTIEDLIKEDEDFKNKE